MTWPTPSFATLSTPISLSLLDGMFAQIANMVSLPCAASGTNAVTLTPNASVPSPASYKFGTSATFNAAANSTSAVTINLAGLGAVPLFMNDGATQVTTQLVSGQQYTVFYDNVAMGFVLTGLYNTPPGSNGQFLTYNTAGAPTFQTFNPGNFVLLNTLTASASASLSDTSSFTSTYSNYLITLSVIRAATSSAQLQMQVHSGGGFQNTSYRAVSFGAQNNANLAGVAATTFVPLSRADAQSTTSGGISGVLMIDSPTGIANPKNFKGVIGYEYTGSQNSVLMVGGQWTSNNAVDGVLFQFSSGNITSGVIKIYGVT